jgi:hypothetical protein
LSFNFSAAGENFDVPSYLSAAGEIFEIFHSTSWGRLSAPQAKNWMISLIISAVGENFDIFP